MPTAAPLFLPAWRPRSTKGHPCARTTSTCVAGQPISSSGRHVPEWGYEPLANRRHVAVTERRTRTDWAHAIRDLVDVHYPAAEKIVLIMDNLNIHSPASLYVAFPAAEARRLTEKLEIHYTPKHGSWLNMAEIEFSILSRQCLDRRLPDH